MHAQANAHVILFIYCCLQHVGRFQCQLTTTFRHCSGVFSAWHSLFSVELLLEQPVPGGPPHDMMYLFLPYLLVVIYVSPSTRCNLLLCKQCSNAVCFRPLPSHQQPASARPAPAPGITEQCSLLLPLLWGAGPMALMLWLDGMMMMMMLAPAAAWPSWPGHQGDHCSVGCTLSAWSRKRPTDARNETNVIVYGQLQVLSPREEFLQIMTSCKWQAEVTEWSHHVDRSCCTVLYNHNSLFGS
jgi:hypothetical protein